MSYMYGILAVLGWVWAVAFVIFVLSLRKHYGRGFEVIESHEKQP